MPTEKPILEVCAGSLASALEAQAGGAFRVELCDNLYEGGTTPSFGTIAAVRKMLQIRLHVIIRPRGGDFLYSELEFEIIKRDVIQCKELGVDGIVIGFLTPDGRIDVQRTREIVTLATPLSVTFHRAFDMTRDPFEAFDDLKQTGIHRILTSGQKNSAIDAAPLIRELINRAGESLIIMPGGGLDEYNIRDFNVRVQAKEYHATLRSEIPSKMDFRRPDVYMGGLSQIPEFSIKQTDEGRVRDFVNMLM
jgi:copper homeostasis protein